MKYFILLLSLTLCSCSGSTNSSEYEIYKSKRMDATQVSIDQKNQTLQKIIFSQHGVDVHTNETFKPSQQSDSSRIHDGNYEFQGEKYLTFYATSLFIVNSNKNKEYVEKCPQEQSQNFNIEQTTHNKITVKFLCDHIEVNEVKIEMNPEQSYLFNVSLKNAIEQIRKDLWWAKIVQ